MSEAIGTEVSRPNVPRSSGGNGNKVGIDRKEWTKMSEALVVALQNNLTDDSLQSWHPE